MSSSGDRQAEIEQNRALGRLETAVARLLEERRVSAERAQRAEERVGELEARLEAARADGTDPVELKEAVSTLEARNAALLERIETGRESVERLLSRIRFLKDQRQG